MTNIQYGNDIYDVDEEYSFGSFVNTYVDIPDKVIVYASQFYWETVDSKPFRDDMKGVTFIKCNLDNIIIPDGNQIIDCSQKRFEAQEDGKDYILDENDEPTLKIN